MTSYDQLFGEIAIQLQLLSQEQVSRCLELQQQDRQGMHIGEIAAELGYLSDGEVKLLMVQQQRVMERQKQEQAARAGGQAPRRNWAPNEGAATLEIPVVSGEQGGSVVTLTNGGEPVGAQAAQQAAAAQRAAAAQQAAAQQAAAQQAAAQQAAAQQAAAQQAAAQAAAQQAAAQAAAQQAAAQQAAAQAAQPQAAPAAAPAEPMSDKAPRARLPKPSPFAAQLLDSYLGKALQHAMRMGASDLHVHSGAPLIVRVDGKLQALGGGTMSADAAESVIAQIMTDEQWALLANRGELDFALDLHGMARLRVNAFRQQRGLDIVFRIIPPRPPSLEELGLPGKLAKLTDFRTGMVLCTGPTGCGKSSTLAALVNLLVQSRSDHILTIEDPIEYTYPAGKALVNQRQVGGHTTSFARALRAALREDPDIIAITELRDRETIGLAMSAAETGHLVLGTLHTGNAGQTINRMISVFPAEEQEQVRVMLSESLRAVLSQRLVPLAAGRGRAPAIELLMVNTAVSNLIREEKSHQLPSVMQTGKAAGMITLDDSLTDLVSSGRVAKEEARRHAVKKERFS